MKILFLSILIASFLGGTSFAQTDSAEVKSVLLGNDPQTSIQPGGIGQVLAPVGTPVVTPPGATYIQPPPLPPTKVPILKQSALPAKGKYNILDPEGKPAPSKNPAVVQKEKNMELLFSNQVTGGRTGENTAQYSSTISRPKKNEPEKIRIPTQEYPIIQKIPYNQ